MSRPTEQEIRDKILEIYTGPKGAIVLSFPKEIELVNYFIGQALIGMIPETDAIKLDWSRAPYWAKGANIVFTETGEWSDMYGEDNNWKSDGKIKPTQYFDRPKPQYQPKVGNPVFVQQNGYLCVGKVHAVSDSGVNVEIDGNIRDYPKHLVKPFDSAKIGMKWSDI